MTTFRAMHESGCFVLPNPWDAGTAKYLQHLGFRALATTSAGPAFSPGLPDGPLPCDAMLDHIREIVARTPRPVNADFQDGYARDVDGVFANVANCAATGVAGLSIEDANPVPRDSSAPLYDRATAIDRVKAAREAIRASKRDVVLT